MFDELTSTQTVVLRLNAVGFSNCETADKMGISEETVKTHIKNIKAKLNLQKATELTAHYWCTLFGTSLEDQRKSILSSCICLILLFSLPIDNFDKRRMRIRSRKESYEYINVTPSII